METKHQTLITKKTEGATPVAENYRALRASCATYLDQQALDKIEDAYRFAADCHRDQRRRSGEPYINHPVEVAYILSSDLHMDEDTICAALLHDTVEDTDATCDQLAKRYGKTVAELVDGVTKLTQVQVSNMNEKQALNLRKMFLAMSRDIRVVIIKLADRLHNMRTLGALPEAKRKFKARETMDVYAPLADRLGISSVKWELEDLAFLYLLPEEYERVARMVAETRAQREQETAIARGILDDELQRIGIEGYQIKGRPKHLWSIYQKMTVKGKKFSDIYDLTALRVLTRTVGDCYTVLGATHAIWHPIPGRFKDYIAMPKANGYQSLHTTAVSTGGRPVEIQIRTFEMHEHAEYGVAAHWLYKRAGNSLGRMSNDERSINSTINHIRRRLDWAVEDEVDDAEEYLDDLRLDLYEHEIFVFTPKGEVVSLRRDSTPLDFAYSVHTEVGNHCVGAKVNGSVVPLSTKLKSGDRVEILTNKNGRPSQDWLQIVVTPGARSKIRKYFAAASKGDNAEAGRAELAKELRKRGYGISTHRVTKAIEKALPALDYRDAESLFAAIGSGIITTILVANRIEAQLVEAQPGDAADKAHEQEKAARADASARAARASRERRRRGRNGVVVKGDPDLLVHLARCCNPVAGDDIVGFITRGRGVSVHRANCPNVRDLMTTPERLIEVEWDTSGATEFQVEIIVEATDRMGLLKDVTAAVSDSGGNILSSSTQVDSSAGVVRMRFLVSISDASLLASLLATVSRVPSVYNARRIMPGEGASQDKKHVRR